MRKVEWRNDRRKVKDLIGRRAYLMELDPKYVDVIVKRWEDFTGKKAEVLNP